MVEPIKPVERRKGDSDLHGKIDALIGMLTMHMTQEELDLAELKAKVDAYFYELDSHTHVFHHNKVAENIKEDEEGHAFWSKIKSSVTEKAIIFILGCISTYLIALIWLDFGDRLRAQPPKEPATISQPVIVRPPVNPNVPNHP